MRPFPAWVTRGITISPEEFWWWIGQQRAQVAIHHILKSFQNHTHNTSLFINTFITHSLQNTASILYGPQIKRSISISPVIWTNGVLKSSSETNCMGIMSKYMLSEILTTCVLEHINNRREVAFIRYRPCYDFYTPWRWRGLWHFLWTQGQRQGQTQG